MHILLTGSVLLVVLLAFLVALLVALRFHLGQLQSIVNMYMCIRIFYTCHAFSTVASGIKTHDSESRGQEEAGRTRRTSELFTRSTALKFVNALNKPP